MIFISSKSNEVKSSYHMEIEGLIRTVDCFKERNVKIRKLVTDRHVQIVKWVRENMQDTKHCVDIWHVAKGNYGHFHGYIVTNYSTQLI